MKAAALDPLFRPRSIAIVGASIVLDEGRGALAVDALVVLDIPVTA